MHLGLTLPVFKNLLVIAPDSVSERTCRTSAVVSLTSVKLFISVCFPLTVIRFEEREAELKKEYNTLHQRHTEVRCCKSEDRIGQ